MIFLHSARDKTSNPLAPPSPISLRVLIFSSLLIAIEEKSWIYISPLVLKNSFISGRFTSLLVLKVRETRALSLIFSQPSRYNSLKWKGLASSAIIAKVSWETYWQNLSERTLSWLLLWIRVQNFPGLMTYYVHKVISLQRKGW